jgi:hypothetical protein
MRTFRRLHLLNLLFTTLCVELSTSILFTLSKPVLAHQKHSGTPFLLNAGNDQDLHQNAFGGPGENRTRVQNTFLVASYNHIHIIHYKFIIVKTFYIVFSANNVTFVELTSTLPALVPISIVYNA